MDRLILLRHGEAERESAGGEDFDRPLASRGRTESQTTAEGLKDLGLEPQLALVSSALRTRQTWESMSPSFPQAAVLFEPGLYLAEAQAIWGRAQSAGRDVGALMIVAHNPGLQDLALTLLTEASAPSGAIGKVRAGFPTGAAVVFLFDANGRPAYDGLFLPRDRR